MATTLLSPVLEDALNHRLDIVGLTVEQYDWLVEQGKLPYNPSTELIDGFIVKKDRSAVGEDPMTIGDRHRTSVLCFVDLNSHFKRLGCFIQSHQPIWIPPRSEPEPDLCVVVGAFEDYKDSKPVGDQILSIIEVADASLRRDLGTKLTMYARAKVAEYIVVNLVDNVVLVHHDPLRGKYRSLKTLRAGDTLAIRAAKNRVVEIAVAKLL